ncbi:MAG: hypothetical protein ACT4O0_03715 [Pseudonocardia sp.]
MPEARAAETRTRVVLHRSDLAALMGTPAPPPGPAPAPAPVEHRPARRALPPRVAVAVGAVAAVGVALRAVALYDTPAPLADEANLVTQVAELAATGSTAVSELSVRIGVLAPAQLAGLTRIGGGWERAPSALGALREVSLLCWLVAALLCWVVGRRLGLSRPWALAGVAALALCPIGIGVARLAVAENLAVCWALGALALAGGPPKVGRAQLRTDLLIAGFLTVAALTAPLAAVFAPVTLIVASRHGDLRRTAMLGLLCLPGTVFALTGTGALAPASGAGGPASWFASGWLGRDLMTIGVVLVVVLVGLWLARWRAFGVGIVLVAVLAAALSLPADAVYPLVLPLAALGLAGIGQDRAASLSGHRPGWVVPAGMVGALALGWSANLAALPEATAPPPTEWARDWLRGNVSATERVMTDDVRRVALTAGGGDWSRVGTPAGCARQALLSAAATPAARCADADWWVLSGDPGQGQGPGPGATLVARFGSDGSADRIEIWSTRLADSAPEREALGRRAAGQMLTASPQLEISDELAAHLRAGSLDSRAATALGALLTEQPVRLIGLPEIGGEQAIGRPLRQLLIAGSPRSGSGNAEQRIVEFFTAQLAPFRPYSMATTPDGVLVRYSPQGPPGLLDSLLTR